MKKLTIDEKKALVLDIDGTLTNSKKDITPATKEAIKKVMEAGHLVILASGRPTPGMKRYEDELELSKYGGYLLSYNGGRIINCTTREVVSQKILPENIPSEIYEFVKEKGAGVISYEGDCVLSAFEPDEFIRLEAKINNLPIKVVPNFPEYIKFPVNKCLVTAPGEQAAEYEKILKEKYQGTLSVYRSEDFFLEIMPNGVDKAETLNGVLGILGVKRENTICCGDGFNDLSMIKFAGIGVAMGNAKDKVKEAADYITGTNDEDGLVTVIEKFVLN